MAIDTVLFRKFQNLKNIQESLNDSGFFNIEFQGNVIVVKSLHPDVVINAFKKYSSTSPLSAIKSLGLRISDNDILFAFQFFGMNIIVMPYMHSKIEFEPKIANMEYSIIIPVDPSTDDKKMQECCTRHGVKATLLQKGSYKLETTDAQNLFWLGMDLKKSIE